MRVLDTVFSVLVLADHAQRDRELLVLVATDEFLEGGLVAVAGEADQHRLGGVTGSARRQRRCTGCRCRGWRRR